MLNHNVFVESKWSKVYITEYNDIDVWLESQIFASLKWPLPF